MGPTIIIPARYGSARLHGKMLMRIRGRSVIEHTFRAACQTGLPVWIATDHDLIAQEAETFGAPVIMTGECQNGTERVAEAVEKIMGRKARPGDGPIVNWQGDSPLVPSGWIRDLIVAVRERQLFVATPIQLCNPDQAAQLRSEALRNKPGGTTVALNERFRAIYFSKSPVPFGGPLWLHVGIYAYDWVALSEYGRDSGPLERSEGLEQLRFIERGFPVHCLPVSGSPIWEVNNFEDLAICERLMEERDAEPPPHTRAYL